MMTWKNSPTGRLLAVGDASPHLGDGRQATYNAISSGARELAQHPHYHLGRFPLVGGIGDVLLKKVMGRCYMRKKYY